MSGKWWLVLFFAMCALFFAGGTIFSVIAFFFVGWYALVAAATFATITWLMGICCREEFQEWQERRRNGLK